MLLHLPRWAEPWSREEAMSSVLSSLGRHHLALFCPLFPSPRGSTRVWSRCKCEKKGHSSCTWRMGVGKGELGGVFRAASHLLRWHPEATFSPCGFLGVLPSAPQDLPAPALLQPVESQTGDTAVTCHRRDPPDLLVWLRAAETSHRRRERERESHPPWKQNVLFSIHPQMQMKHVYSPRPHPLPDPRCCLEKVPAFSSVSAHPGSVENAEYIQEILPPAAFTGSIPSTPSENSIEGWGGQPSPCPPAEPCAIAMQTTLSLDSPDLLGNDSFTICCLFSHCLCLTSSPVIAERTTLKPSPTETNQNASHTQPPARHVWEGPRTQAEGPSRQRKKRHMADLSPGICLSTCPSNLWLSHFRQMCAQTWVSRGCGKRRSHGRSWKPESWRDLSCHRAQFPTLSGILSWQLWWLIVHGSGRQGEASSKVWLGERVPALPSLPELQTCIPVILSK